MSPKPIRRRKKVAAAPPVQEDKSNTRTPPPKNRPPRRQKKHSIDPDHLLAEIETFEMESVLRGRLIQRRKTGDQVTGTITRIDSDLAFVDIGDKAEAMLNLPSDSTYQIKEEITATIVRIDGRGIWIANQLKQHSDLDGYTEAYTHQIPVEGTVTAENAGGFTISLGGLTGFCPRSQIDIHLESAETYLGKKFEFAITELTPREAILSRKKLLMADREAKRSERLAQLNVGQQVQGRVVRHTNFGVFVDIGGIDGLVPRALLTRFQAELKEGQDVLVSIDALKDDRISLSVPSLDPWLKLGNEYVTGGVYQGTLIKKADFGVFVRLEPGLDGLVHNSEIERSSKETRVLFGTLKATVAVQVLQFDSTARRLSLAPSDGESSERHPAVDHSQRKATFGSTFSDILSQIKDS